MPYISKEEVAQKRKELKRALPEFKLSVVNQDRSKICVTILEGPIDMLPKGKTYTQVNHFYIQEHYEDQPAVRAVLQTIYNIISRNQHELVYDSDYGSVPTFYVSINIGDWERPYTIKAPEAAKSPAPKAQSKNHYTDGYLPKIQYWTERMSKEAAKGNLKGIQFASKKVEYFIEHQESLAA